MASSERLSPRAGQWQYAICRNMIKLHLHIFQPLLLQFVPRSQPYSVCSWPLSLNRQERTCPKQQPSEAGWAVWSAAQCIMEVSMGATSILRALGFRPGCQYLSFEERTALRLLLSTIATSTVVLDTTALRLAPVLTHCAHRLEQGLAVIAM